MNGLTALALELGPTFDADRALKVGEALARSIVNTRLLDPPVPQDLESTTSLRPEAQDATRIRRQTVLQQWEGAVVAVDSESFTAEIWDITDPIRADEELKLSLDELDEDDRKLVTVGTIFDWTIGFDLLPGEKRRFSLIKFRRLPRWTQRELDKFRDQARGIAARMR